MRDDWGGVRDDCYTTSLVSKLVVHSSKIKASSKLPRAAQNFANDAGK